MWQLRIGCLVPIVATVCGVCFARTNGEVMLAVAVTAGFLAFFAWGVASYGTVTVELQSVEREIVVLKTWEELVAGEIEATGDEKHSRSTSTIVYYVQTQLGDFRIPKTWYRTLLLGHTYVARLRTVNGKPVKLDWKQPLCRVSTGLTVRCPSCEHDFIIADDQAGNVDKCPNCNAEMNFPFVESRAGQLIRREMAKEALENKPGNEG